MAKKKYDDQLGDDIKAAEAEESERRVGPGEFMVVRIDGMNFSKFTSEMEKPYDEKMANAMRVTCRRLVEQYSPVLGYVQSDEITLVFDPEQNMPFDGRLQKSCGAMAGQGSSYFMVEGFEHFRELTLRKAPAFEGRANGYPSLTAAMNVVWRELDARRNAATGAGRKNFTQKELAGKSPTQIKAMLATEGVDFYTAYPSYFRRGSIFRRREVEQPLSEETLASIPEKYREQKRGEVVRRSMVVELDIHPPLYAIGNLEGFLFDDEEPVVLEKAFASSVTP